MNQQCEIALPMCAAPNPRLQRTPPAAPSSPLSRQPLGRMRVFRALASVALIGLTSCHTYWSGAKSFRSHLKCDMSPEQVEELAKRHGSSSFRKEAERRPWKQPTEFHLFQGSTLFFFWFFGDQLKVVQAGRRFGLEGLDLASPEHLCSTHPVAMLELALYAPPELAGAFVYLDGLYVGDLTESSGVPSRSASIQVLGLEPGQHEISLEKEHSVIRRSFIFEPTAAWPQREHLSIDLSKEEQGSAA